MKGKQNKQGVRRLLTLAFLWLALITAPAALAQGSTGTGGSGGTGGSNGGTSNSPDGGNANPGGAGLSRLYYGQRFPVAAQVMQLDTVKDGKSAEGSPVQHTNPGDMVYQWPSIVPTAQSTPPTARDGVIGKNLFKTFGYPVSDSQFQIIERYNHNRMLEQMFDPERAMWTTQTAAGMGANNAANSVGSSGINQVLQAIDYCSMYLNNFTAEPGNVWQKLRDQLFIPMAVLLLLPGAVLAQVRAIVAQGSPVLIGQEVHPFEGILRSIVAIFLIPGSFLVINYGIDVANSITFTIADEYKHLFASDMYSDAKCAILRAVPVEQSKNRRNALTQTEQPTSSGSTVWAVFEGTTLVTELRDPCAGIDNVQVKDEDVTYTKALTRLFFNMIINAQGLTWDLACTFQMVYLYYLWCMGPIAAALWVWPVAALRKAMGSWCEGVIIVCFWSLFWNTVILLMACFRGVGESGTVVQSALLILALSSVKAAFDFSGVASEAIATAANYAASAAKQMASGAGGGAGGGGGGQQGAHKPGGGGAHHHGGGANHDAGNTAASGTSPTGTSTAGSGSSTSATAANHGQPGGPDAGIAAAGANHGAGGLALGTGGSGHGGAGGGHGDTKDAGGGGADHKSDSAAHTPPPAAAPPGHGDHKGGKKGGGGHGSEGDGAGAGGAGGGGAAGNTSVAANIGLSVGGSTNTANIHGAANLPPGVHSSLADGASAGSHLNVSGGGHSDAATAANHNAHSPLDAANANGATPGSTTGGATPTGHDPGIPGVAGGHGTTAPPTSGLADNLSASAHGAAGTQTPHTAVDNSGAHSFLNKDGTLDTSKVGPLPPISAANSHDPNASAAQHATQDIMAAGGVNNDKLNAALAHPGGQDYCDVRQATGVAPEMLKAGLEGNSGAATVATAGFGETPMAGKLDGVSQTAHLGTQMASSIDSGVAARAAIGMDQGAASQMLSGSAAQSFSQAVSAAHGGGDPGAVHSAQAALPSSGGGSTGDFSWSQGCSVGSVVSSMNPPNNHGGGGGAAVPGGPTPPDGGGGSGAVASSGLPNYSNFHQQMGVDSGSLSRSVADSGSGGTAPVHTSAPGGSYGGGTTSSAPDVSYGGSISHSVSHSASVDASSTYGGSTSISHGGTSTTHQGGDIAYNTSTGSAPSSSTPSVSGGGGTEINHAGSSVSHYAGDTSVNHAPASYSQASYTGGDVSINHAPASGGATYHSAGDVAINHAPAAPSGATYGGSDTTINHAPAASSGATYASNDTTINHAPAAPSGATYASSDTTIHHAPVASGGTTYGGSDTTINHAPAAPSGATYASTDTTINHGAPSISHQASYPSGDSTSVQHSATSYAQASNSSVDASSTTSINHAPAAPSAGVTYGGTDTTINHAPSAPAAGPTYASTDASVSHSQNIAFNNGGSVPGGSAPGGYAAPSVSGTVSGGAGPTHVAYNDTGAAPSAPAGGGGVVYGGGGGAPVAHVGDPAPNWGTSAHIPAASSPSGSVPASGGTVYADNSGGGGGGTAGYHHAPSPTGGYEYGTGTSSSAPAQPTYLASNAAPSDAGYTPYNPAPSGSGPTYVDQGGGGGGGGSAPAPGTPTFVSNDGGGGGGGGYTYHSAPIEPPSGAGYRVADSGATSSGYVPTDGGTVYTPSGSSGGGEVSYGGATHGGGQSHAPADGGYYVASSGSAPANVQPHSSGGGPVSGGAAKTFGSVLGGLPMGQRSQPTVSRTAQNDKGAEGKGKAAPGPQAPPPTQVASNTPPKSAPFGPAANNRRQSGKTQKELNEELQRLADANIPMTQKPEDMA